MQQPVLLVVRLLCEVLDHDLMPWDQSRRIKREVVQKEQKRTKHLKEMTKGTYILQSQGSCCVVALRWWASLSCSCVPFQVS